VVNALRASEQTVAEHRDEFRREGPIDHASLGPNEFDRSPHGVTDMRVCPQRLDQIQHLVRVRRYREPVAELDAQLFEQMPDADNVAAFTSNEVTGEHRGLGWPRRANGARQGPGRVLRCCRQVAATGVGVREKADAATCFGGCRAVSPRARRGTAR